jgi:hypothetical protein
MAYHGKTPATILTAPTSTPKQVVSHTPWKETIETPSGKQEIQMGFNHVNHTASGEVDKLTGVYTNPQRAERKARAALKRARRNKGGRKGTGR